MVAEKEEVKITGTVKKIRFKNEDNGFTIFSFEEENTENIYSVTGTFFKLEENDAVTLSGVFSNHPKFGQQFKASHYELYIPKDMNALRGYADDSKFNLYWSYKSKKSDSFDWQL